MATDRARERVPALERRRTAVCGTILGRVAPLCGIFLATAAFANGEEPAPSEDVTASGAASPGWEVSLSPYLWFAGLNGDVGAFPRIRPVQVDASFGDIFDNLDFTAMAILQARKGRFVSMVDVAYLDLGISKDIGIRDPSFLTAGLDTSTLTATAAAGYRAVDQGGTFLDLMAGLRVSSVDATLSLSGPVRSISAGNEETWVDAVGAARFRADLGGGWALVAYADMGAGSSDLTWQLQGAIQYQLGRRWMLSGGWRQYGVDYEKDNFVYDVTLSGPILGITYQF